MRGSARRSPVLITGADIDIFADIQSPGHIVDIPQRVSRIRGFGQKHSLTDIGIELPKNGRPLVPAWLAFDGKTGNIDVHTAAAQSSNPLNAEGAKSAESLRSFCLSSRSPRPQRSKGLACSLSSLSRPPNTGIRLSRSDFIHVITHERRLPAAGVRLDAAGAWKAPLLRPTLQLAASTRRCTTNRVAAQTGSRLLAHPARR